MAEDVYVNCRIRQRYTTMTPLFPFLAFVLYTQTQSVWGYTRCMECEDMPHPQDCNLITFCTPYEICYTEQVVTSGGLIKYNSGCLSKDRCQATGKRDLQGTSQYLAERRNARSIQTRQDEVSQTDIPTCIECCNGDFCNVQGCGEKAVALANRGPTCFLCPDAEDPESCRRVIQCYQGQVCVLRKENIYSNLWKTGCIGERQCTALVHIEELQEARLSLIGKRETVQVNKCPRCCSDDFCNHSCRQNLTFTVETTTHVPTTHLVPTHPKTTHKPTTKPPPPTTTTQKTTTLKPTTTAHKLTTTTHKPTRHPHTTHAHPPHTKVHTTHGHHQHTHTTTTTKPLTKATHAPTTTHRPTTKPTTHTPTTKDVPKPTTHAPTTTTHRPTTKPTTHAPTTKAMPKATTHAPTTTTHRPTTKPSTHAPTTKPTTHAPPTTTIPTTIPTTTDPKVECESDDYVYYPHLRLCLMFYTDLKNWTDARDYCQSKHGVLVVKGSGEEKMKDVLQIYATHHYNVQMWVGATSQGSSTIYVWGDGTHENVDTTEGKDLSLEQCVYLIHGSYHNSDICSLKHGFICERLKSSRQSRDI